METNKVKSEELKQYIIVKMGREQYGINIIYIQNIVRMQGITRVPKAPFYFKGVINLRGEIIPVMSLRLRFGFEPEDYTNSTRIIIVKLAGNAIGLIVDEVLEVIELPDEDVQQVSKDATDEKSSHILGVGKIRDDLVTLLNLEGFINIG